MREFNQRVVTIDHGKIIGDTKSGRFAVGVSGDYDDDDYSAEYDEYDGDGDFTDDEIIKSYSDLGYDDINDDLGDDLGDSPQYPDNVVIVPDDDDRLD